MSNVPFLYVNLIAMCGYAIIFISFVAAKKNAVIGRFIALLVSFILWTGCSILMRLQVPPGLDFWYYVSILALFCIAVLTYIFVNAFLGERNVILTAAWIIGTIGILIFTALGVFLQPPEAVVTKAGTVFEYSVGWQIAIPYVFFAFVVVSIYRTIVRSVKRNGARPPGMRSMVAGCIIIAFGNLLQLIPGNIFPWDTLSGIVAAGFLVYSMYRKRMFRMTLLVSRGVVLFSAVFVCLLVAINYVGPIIIFLTDALPVTYQQATSIVILLDMFLVWHCYLLLKKLMDVLFSREEMQEKLVKSFSEKVSKTLDSQHIMALLSETVKEELSTENVYICLYENGEYVSKYVSSPLTSHKFSLRGDVPLAAYAKNTESCFTMREFQGSTAHLSMWDSEKMLLRQLGVSCILTFIDGADVVGFALLSGKEKNTSYTAGDMNFLSTLSTIAGIAMKNASLFEQVAREARTDAMTGVYNYRYFTKVIKEKFRDRDIECLALLFIDLDDFKLYNQLYGANEGDQVLKKVAALLDMAVGENGSVFRYSGKIFAVILPQYDARMARKFARSVQEEIGKINFTGLRSSYKKLTASCGICVAPYAASTWNELVDNTDLAVYKAKNSGKDSIVVYTGNDNVSFNIRKKVERIIGNNESTVLGNSSQTIFALIAAIDAKDHYTAQHSKNVAKYAAYLAAADGMNDDQILMTYAAGLLHDIGKISIPENILGKQGKLTDEEYEIIKGHVNGSIDMIRHLPSMDYLIPAAIGHHERWDGKGYPRGIAGEEIPVSARCLAIADAFDAMTTDRPYRKGLTAEYAVAQIEEGAGTQFEPELAHLFVKLVRDMEIVVRSKEK